jgi:histidyl-tRNA synthetase
MADDNQVEPAPKKTIRNPLGVFDILPDQQLYYTHVKKVVRHRCRQSGFRRITTPTFEYTELFERAIGTDTDLVRNKLYNFTDPKEKAYTLRPEGTAGVIRAYLQHDMKELPQPVELYYIEPHYRYDRPQKGTFRQFWQFGYEVIGELDPALDAQVIQLSHKILEDLGISELLTLQINSIGCEICREKYLVDLQNYYVGKERSICTDCLPHIESNPMRLLSCEEEDCQILAKLAPQLNMYLCKGCKEFHTKMLEYLDETGIKYVENDQLIRGMNYYTRTVFEFWNVKQNGHDVMGGGGRYDRLVEELGGDPTPAIGAAFNFERIIHTMKREKLFVPSKDNLHIFVAQLGDQAKKKCMNLLWELRERGVKTVGALGKGSMKGQIQLATKFEVPYTLILGITEVRDGTIIIRDMAKGQQRIVPFDTIIDEVVNLIGEKNLDKYSPGEIVYS